MNEEVFFKEEKGENPKEVSHRVRGRHWGRCRIDGQTYNVNTSAITFCMTRGKGLVCNQGVKITESHLHPRAAVRTSEVRRTGLGRGAGRNNTRRERGKRVEEAFSRGKAFLGTRRQEGK